MKLMRGWNKLLMKATYPFDNYPFNKKAIKLKQLIKLYNNHGFDFTISNYTRFTN